MFWDDLKVTLNSLNMVIRLDIKDVLFGILDSDNINILVCILKWQKVLRIKIIS